MKVTNDDINYVINECKKMEIEIASLEKNISSLEKTHVSLAVWEKCVKDVYNRAMLDNKDPFFSRVVGKYSNGKNKTMLNQIFLKMFDEECAKKRIDPYKIFVH